jgi:hypothetical protein
VQIRPDDYETSDSEVIIVVGVWIRVQNGRFGLFDKHDNVRNYSLH